MRKVLIVGAGKSSPFLIKHLIENSVTENLFILIADANLQKIRLHREIPDGDEVITYELDLSSFISSGDRSSFVKIMPNDMILVPTRTVPLILKKISTTGVILNLINLYLNIKSR